MTHPAVERAFRDEWGRVVASLIGFLGDFDLAEDAAQEAFVIAAERWARTGAPANPGAWLTTTARNRAIDRLGRERVHARKAQLLQIPEAGEEEMDETVFPDERLELIFTCCHPALALDALPGYHYLDAARADLLRRLGRVDEARDAYRRALALTAIEHERTFLERRLAEL